MYNDGSYLLHNPGWHADDSSWKAKHIVDMISRNEIEPARVGEIGCGAGEILLELSRLLPGSVRFDGYEISADAHQICAPKATDRVHFHQGDLFAREDSFDLLLAIDVVEHVEDYFSFLRRIKTRATYKIFHIPLELSAWMVARRSPLLHQRLSVGHIHHFSKDTALATLRDTGYELIDFSYTSGRTELPGLSWKTRLLKHPRRALARVSPDAAARVLGGYSLLVLAR